MKTARIILKVPFYKHPAGTVFDLAGDTEPADWPEDERLRERLDFSNKMGYLLPDGGRGFAVNLPVNDTAPCPEHVFDDVDIRRGESRATLVGTHHSDESRTGSEAAPCGRLREENVAVERHPVLNSERFVINLPPFEAVAEKMVLLDSLRGQTVLEYVLHNYKSTDTQLTWDVSDLHPGFYELRVCFPGDWFHTVRFIKFFPSLVDIDNLPPAPAKPWQRVVDQVLKKFTVPATDGATDLDNEALDLCLEWGEMFEKPTQERMMQRHPELTPAKADELDRLAREVRSFVYNLCEQELDGKIAESDLHFTTKRQYPWVNAANFNRMKNVGMYYARR